MIQSQNKQIKYSTLSLIFSIIHSSRRQLLCSCGVHPSNWLTFDPAPQISQMRCLPRGVVFLRAEMIFRESMNITGAPYYLNSMEQKVQQYENPPPNYSLNQHATNGFSHRLSPAQIGSYLVIGFTICVYFSCTNPLDPNSTLVSLFCVFLFILSLSSCLATTKDPTDRVVYYYKWSRHDRKVTFSPQYDKVLFCQFCDSYCRSTSKHCRSCNRCVDVFDHHCMWFNNCVGEKNYRYFIVSILATFSFAVVVIIHVTASSFGVDYSQGEEVIKIVFSWVAALMMAIFGFLLFNLIALHVYLNVHGLTTYQFLQMRKKEEEELKKRKEEREKTNKASNNKVMPMDIHGSSQSEESFANIKKIVVSKNEKLEQETPIDQTGTGNQNLDKSNKVQAQKEEEEVEDEEEVEKKENFIFNETVSRQESSKGNNRSPGGLEEEREDREQRENLRKESGDSLPRFLLENRSLKFMLPRLQAQSPTRKRQHSHGSINQ